MTRTRRRVARATIAGLAAAALVPTLAACGSSSSSSSSSSAPTDVVSAALQTPGVRTVILAKQRNDITIIVPPCSPTGQHTRSAGQANGGTGSTTAGVHVPAGSSRIVIPAGTLTQTVAVQPCQPQQPGVSSSGSSSSSSGSSSASSSGSSSSASSSGSNVGQAVSTIVMTPGGTTPETSQQTQTQGNQLVVPENSRITTLVVTPCTVATAPNQQQSPAQTKGQVLPATERAVTAPPCTVPGSGGGSSSSG